jgi:TonB family protein
MKKGPNRKRKRTAFLFVPLCLIAAVLAGTFFSAPIMKSWTRIFPREKGHFGPEEKRIREEIVLKRMEDPTLYHDWKSIAPDYPRPRKMEGMSPKERVKALKETPEFKEMDRELKDYLRKKEDLFQSELPSPSLKEEEVLVPNKDRGAEKVIERLVGGKEQGPAEKKPDENVLMGMKGPAASRKILERPSLPRVKLKVEAEIELTFWVLPDGTVSRAVPSVKGDAELERIAVQYLKGWRFAPLPQEVPQVEQWGSLPVKFRLK